MNRQLIFDPNIRFKCNKCGSCCSNLWEIRVAEDFVKQIQNLPLTEISSDFSKISPIQIQPDLEGKPQYFFAHRSNNCCFLDADNLCELQKHFGYDIKSSTCKLFPFRFVEIDEKLYIGNSFACPSILDKTGNPVDSYSDDLTTLASLYDDRVLKKNEILLSNDTKLTPDQYLKIEEFLIDILNNDSVSFNKRLIAGAVALDMLDGFLFAATSITKLSQEECIDKFINNNKTQNFEQLFKIANKKVSFNLIKRVFLGMILSFRTTLSKRRGHFKTYSMLVINHILFSLELGKFKLTPNSKKISFRKISKVEFSDDNDEINNILLRYFNHLLIRKDLLYHKDIKSGFQIFLIYYSLIKLYTCGICVEKGITKATQDEVKEAVGLMEKYYVFHSDFFQLMRTYPVIRDTIENLLKSKNFPFIMAS